MLMLCLVGYLFLLSTGIFWGFKKPVAFFAFDNILSVSYTSVLQRTFNLNITTRTSDADEGKDFEFSMIDQADFVGIDAYVKMHGLNDASMAEQRRAKKANINGLKGEDGGKGAGDGEDETELEKAQREMEDAEDEEEDDYDPGSEGESEGSGSSSGGDEAEGYEYPKGENMAEELGSELEGVEEDA